MNLILAQTPTACCLSIEFNYEQSHKRNATIERKNYVSAVPYLLHGCYCDNYHRSDIKSVVLIIIMKQEPIEAIFVKFADAQQQIEENQKKLKEKTSLAEIVGEIEHVRLGDQIS